MKISTYRKALGVALFWLFIWQILYWFVGKDLIVPSPLQTFKTLGRILSGHAFYLDAAATLSRCVAGIFYSLLVGLVTAFLSYRLSLVRHILSLPVLVFKATPVMAVILFLILCLTSGQVPIFVCFLMCYPVVYTNTLSGLDALGHKYLEMAKLYQLSQADTLRHVMIPAILPQLLASMRLLAGLSWKTVVAAEVLASPHFSMGYNLLNAKIYLETPELFAWIISIICLSLAFEKILCLGLNLFSLKPYSGSKVLKNQRWSKGKSNDSSIGDELSSSVVIHNLSKSYAQKQIFSNFNAVFPENKTTAILAPSGAGKTTLLRILAGLEPYPCGKIEGIQKGRVSFLFQEDRLLPWLNVYDNMAIVLKNQMSSQKAHAEIVQMLHLLNLTENLYNMPDQLSGGMKHRVAIGRTFLYPATLLLLDEPFRGIDSALKERLFSTLWPIYAGKKTILLATHQQEDVNRLADQQISLS